MKNLIRQIREILKYPSAVAGLGIILILFIIAIYTLITIPYQEAISKWRGSEEVWYANPQYAPPAWTNFFSKVKKPVSFSINSVDAGDDDRVTKVVEARDEDTSRTDITFTFDYSYDDFPQEMSIYFTSEFAEKNPFVSVLWITPDGREIRITDMGVGSRENYRMSQDAKLERRVGGIPAMQGLFIDPEGDPSVPQKGTYQVVVDGINFEKDGSLDAEFVLYGQVFGWAGTDHLRRDLMLPLQYGVSVALAFGLMAALGTSALTMVIAAVGTWYGGWVDELIQRITEVNLVLPFLSILILVGTFYSRSIWTILGVTILLSIFTGGIKGYRAIFLQVKESPYIEAAKAYGASNTRLIFLYLIPRMIPLLIPTLVSAVPAFVFLEASLAVLGIGDPVLPTWGKIINDAQVNAALYKGLYYWVLEPAVLLMITGLGFAMLGYSLDRIFNPRLRGL
jgi:peptide/nickel transport system permease protein